MIKQLRYQSYEMEQQLVSRSAADASLNVSDTNQRRLQSARLYVLITESLCHNPWKQVVEDCLAAGADVLQLREKHLNDREILRRANWIRDAAHSAGALFIVNDRADLAAASEADGIHVGQDEMNVAECRTLLQRSQLVGVSTHTPDQIEAAIRDKADYIGVGPVFPSRTKSFEDFAGTAFVKHAANSCHLPWFAIGGINTDNVPLLTSVGCGRIAVSSAVIASANPQEAIVHLLSLLPPLKSL
jgi:thiamine-phosphate pyrophosphorylase